MKFNFWLLTVLTKVHYWLMYLLRKALTIIELFIFLRLILKFLDANSQSFIVALIYEVTEKILFPFRGIFPDLAALGHSLDVVAISGIVGYFLAYFVLGRILSLLIRG